MDDTINTNRDDRRIVMPSGVHDPRTGLPDACECGAGPDHYRAALGGTVLCVQCGRTLMTKTKE